MIRLLFPILLISSCDRIQERAPEVFEGTDGIMRIVYAGLLLALVWGGASVSRQGGWLKTFRNIIVIVASFLVLIVGYTYKDSLGTVYNRVKAEILPGSAQSLGGGEVILRRDPRSGHFETTGLVNGIEVPFLIDTGASSIVLPYEDAIALGYTNDDLNFVLQVSTANGNTFVAPIRLNAVKIGDIVVNDIRAAVSQKGELSSGLLGLSFLDRLEGYSVSGDVLTLRE